MSTAPETRPDPSGGPTKDQVMKGHSYDGIREYDNPMPGWWLWIFWATIAFSLIYILGLHVFHVIPSYEDDLASAQQQIETQRAAFEKAAPKFEATDASLAKLAEDKAAVSAGSATYTQLCAACHGDKGQGGIGPNLTDKFWLHGGKISEVFNTVTHGVPDKGMPAWEGSLSPEQRAQVVAFIHSLQGTNPSGAKEPQGTEV